MEPDFIVQGGDPLGNGTGGPGYETEEDVNDLKNVKGAISMAKSTGSTKVGSQFFINLADNPSLDQSAGVVFSRATALEVQRRSEVLLPLMEPNWKIMTGLTNFRSGHKDGAASSPLTAESLIRICADSQLGFVISPVRLDLQPLRHENAGAWKDSNLYDCRKIRSAMPAP